MIIPPPRRRIGFTSDSAGEFPEHLNLLHSFLDECQVERGIRIVFQRGIFLFHDAAAWLAQIVMFVVL